METGSAAPLVTVPAGRPGRGSPRAPGVLVLCGGLRGHGPGSGGVILLVTHLLLDFFGTVVSCSPSRTEQGYHSSRALARSMGARISYPEFLQARAAESARFDERSAVDDSEFSMEKVAAAFLARALDRAPDPADSPG